MSAEQIPEATPEQCTRDCRHGSLVPRDSFDRPIVAGRTRTRISTLSKALDDGYNLGLWKARTAVLGVCQPQASHLRERVLSSSGEDDTLRKVTDEALVLGGEKVAATRGSSLHDVVSLLNRGKPMPAGLSDSTRTSAEAYMRTLDSIGLVPILSEQFVVCESWEAAGTPDGYFRDRDGCYLIGDVKTGAKSWERSYPLSVSMQLAAYADGRRFCPVHSFLPTPWVDRERALLISLPVDTDRCEVFDIDIKAGADRLGLAVSVRRARSEQRTLNLGERKGKR